MALLVIMWSIARTYMQHMTRTGTFFLLSQRHLLKTTIIATQVMALIAAWKVASLCPYWTWRLPGLVSFLPRVRPYHSVPNGIGDQALYGNRLQHNATSFRVNGYHDDTGTKGGSQSDLTGSVEHQMVMCALLLQGVYLLFLHSCGHRIVAMRHRKMQ